MLMLFPIMIHCVTQKLIEKASHSAVLVADQNLTNPSLNSAVSILTSPRPLQSPLSETPTLFLYSFTLCLICRWWPHEQLTYSGHYFIGCHVLLRKED